MDRTDYGTQFRKGALELAILGLLRQTDLYGGELVERLGSYPGLATSPGTIYPLLARLKSGGLVDTTWQESPVGPPRKYYRLTESGIGALESLGSAWHQLSADMESILRGDGRDA